MPENLEYSMLLPNVALDKDGYLVELLFSESHEWLGTPTAITLVNHTTGEEASGKWNDRSRFCHELTERHILFIRDDSLASGNCVSIERHADSLICTASIDLAQVFRRNVDELERWLCTAYAKATLIAPCVAAAGSEVSLELPDSPISMSELVTMAYSRAYDWFWLLVPQGCVRDAIGPLTVAQKMAGFVLLRNSAAIQSTYAQFQN